eukprot:2484988-Pyramimonas_sp.AAC.1
MTSKTTHREQSAFTSAPSDDGRGESSCAHASLSPWRRASSAPRWYLTDPTPLTAPLVAR